MYNKQKVLKKKKNKKNSFRNVIFEHSMSFNCQIATVL